MRILLTKNIKINFDTEIKKIIYFYEHTWNESDVRTISD